MDVVDCYYVMKCLCDNGQDKKNAVLSHMKFCILLLECADIVILFIIVIILTSF